MNELGLIISIVGVIIIIAISIVFFLKFKKSKESNDQADKVKFLQEKLKYIYGQTSLNFALYLSTGERDVLIIDGEKCDNDVVLGGILCNNLFENPILTQELTNKLEKEKQIDCEIDTSTNRYISLNSGKDAIYHVTIKEISNNKYKYITIIRDITANVENVEEKKKFEQLTEFATKRSMVGIAYYNIKTRAGKATMSWYENLCEEEGTQIIPHYQNIQPEVKEAINEYISSLAKGERNPFIIEFEIKTPNGIKWIKEHIFIHNVRDKNNIEVIDINMDVTELKESENILIALNNQVMEAKKESDKFLNSISHEIRTPLNSIVGFSGLYVSTEEEEEKKQFEDIIKMNINQLIELVNNILIISKLDSHSVKVVTESIPLNKLLVSLKEETDTLLKEDKAYVGKEIIINCDTPNNENYISTDRKMLNQVFTNLLSNALKFTERGTITIGYQKEGETYNFYVKDTGLGIAQKNLSRLFDRFEKIDTFTQGTGLGLPLCKSILQTLGGDISIKSELNKGSEFYFTLNEK